MGRTRPIFVYFCSLFTWQIENKFDYNWYKHRLCAWDSNPGRQDGKCRRIHWAMAAPPRHKCLGQFFIICCTLHWHIVRFYVAINQTSFFRRMLRNLFLINNCVLFRETGWELTRFSYSFIWNLFSFHNLV